MDRDPHRLEAGTSETWEMPTAELIEAADRLDGPYGAGVSRTTSRVTASVLLGDGRIFTSDSIIFI